MSLDGLNIQLHNSVLSVMDRLFPYLIYWCLKRLKHVMMRKHFYNIFWKLKYNGSRERVCYYQERGIFSRNSETNVSEFVVVIISVTFIFVINSSVSLISLGSWKS